MLKRTQVRALAGLAMACAGSAAYGQLSANVIISSQQLSANSYEYFVSMKNTGTQSIDALWFAWLPGYDLLGTVPTSVSSPANWGETNEQEASFGGSASALWQTSTAPLGTGQTLSGFSFITADPPSLVQGSSPVFGFPTEYSYIYSGAADPGGAGGALVIAQTVVPEPTMLGMMVMPVVWVLRRKKASPPGRR